MQDSYKRLLAPSLENELRASLKEKVDQEAIKVFVDNLRELLLASPLGRKRVMALDPGFRTGAKLVWCSTTPIAPETPRLSNDDVTAYNAVAKKIMECELVIPY